MLSLLLAIGQAAIDTYDQPAALCPPCHEEEPDTVFGVVMSMLKSVVSMLVIVFPLYKTFKAFESNRLRACRTMLAYWSAMTLLNALKDVTDEIVGKHINTTIHHLLLAAIKLAPLVLGPDKIYDLTVRSFFEHHEAEMDAMVLAGTEKAQEFKDAMEPTIEKVKGQVAKMEASVEPTIEQIRESLRESVDSVKTTLGMETETADASIATGSTTELTAEEAVRRDEELTVVEDSTSKTGLRQRSARPDASSSSPTGVTADAESEIERAKAAQVLVEKIVWGHGLSAKNTEYQRQVKEKEAAQDDVMADVHTVANQFNTTPGMAPADQVAYNKTSTATTTTITAPATTAAAAPPLPPRPAASTEAITITNSTTQPMTAATSTAAPLSLSSASSNVSAARPTANAATTKTVLDSRSVASSGGKTVLLDTRSIPNVVETYAADYQKEL